MTHRRARKESAAKRSPIRAIARFLRDNGLSLAMAALFLCSLIGQSIAGFYAHNDEQREHGQAELGYLEYLGSGDFGESVFENWESEFLQMGAFILLTVVLRQKGSAESKDMEGEEEVDEDPAKHRKPDSPWPVHRGGLALKLYSHSLGLAFLALFLASFVLHGLTGMRAYNEEQLAHGGHVITALQYFGSSRFWFESFQNWQSEFLAVGAMIVLSIFLRQRGSPESKPVAAPHHATGK